MLSVLIFFFFFQAEDGIRAGHVTGVQTCALPISSPSNRLVTEPSSKTARMARASSGAIDSWVRRSEERRVGKECRSRGSPCCYKKKKGESDRVNGVKEKRSKRKNDRLTMRLSKTE